MSDKLQFVVYSAGLNLSEIDKLKFVGQFPAAITPCPNLPIVNQTCFDGIVKNVFDRRTKRPVANEVIKTFVIPKLPSARTMTN